MESLAGYSAWGNKESEMTEQLSLSVIFKLGKYKGLDALSWAGGEWYRRWKTASKDPVKNVELWKELLELMKKHNVTFHKVKGHSDNELKNRCDELATSAIKEVI